MRLSLFTPTNNPRHLAEAHDALKTQNATWEWVIVRNNGATEEQIDPSVKADSRVRIIQGPDTDKIGALKLFACKACRGDALIEYDHDDLLVPGTLEKVANQFKENAGFVYSDSAVFTHDKDKIGTWGYSADFGWEHYDIRVYGRRYVATRTFDITPRSLCEIYFAPDHLRAWSRDVYEKIGGHDPSLSVGDDHDLLCRTYLAGTKFAHIGGCGYLYRYHPDNTVKERQAMIASQTNVNRRKYLQPLIEEWCNRNEHARLTLTGLKDLKSLQGAGHVYLKQFLQRVNANQQVDTFNSVFRALVPGGYLTVDVPGPNGKYADQDPRNVQRFNDNSFRYYTDRFLAQTNGQINCRFQLIDVREYYPDEEHEKRDMKVLRAELVALKGQRHPGKQLI